MRKTLAVIVVVAVAARAIAEAPSTRPTIAPVEVRYGIYLARHESVTSVAADGALTQRQTDNQRYGPSEGTWEVKWTTRRGQLTPEQIAELAALLDAGIDVPFTPRSVPDGPSVSVRYGEKSIRGDPLPAPVEQARLLLRTWADAMPVVEPQGREATRPTIAP